MLSNPLWNFDDERKGAYFIKYFLVARQFAANRAPFTHVHMHVLVSSRTMIPFYPARMRKGQVIGRIVVVVDTKSPNLKTHNEYVEFGEKMVPVYA